MKSSLLQVFASLKLILIAFWKETPVYVIGALRSAVSTIEVWLYDTKHASYGIAVTRIIFACAALGILLTNFSTRHYTYGSAAAWSGHLETQYGIYNDIAIFQIFQNLAVNDVLVTVYFLVTMLLAVGLLVGYRGRIVLPVFLLFWINLIEAPYFGGDQGDSALRISLILMLFTDHSGRLSFDAKRRAKVTEKPQPIVVKLYFGNRVLPAQLTNLLHNLAIVALACQISIIYVSGALFKAGGAPWKDGSAIYGPLSMMRYSPWPEINDLITVSAVVVAIGSIGSVVLQVIFPGALLFRWTRIPILFAMVSFHLGIAVLMGLPWFSLSMIAIDAIFVRDVTWLRLIGWFKRAASGRPAAGETATKHVEESIDEREKALV
ncbi:HTTM domain-containing protein [Glutamicibacter sp. MNS18]|uniref:HTTM domain-containing protein n=1 Tax=Glutamicibacter sp. MNS18 TaxID=2989817 RepID=UPI002235D45E|nr:HTTM domain-containing protein [Glutamicibacter sp. MNS18]MCW4467153.1 HTTM domain-containing protein [Glutamicibacter sp. MNS18]